MLELLLVTSGSAVAKQLQSLCYCCKETVLGMVTHLPANSALHFFAPPRESCSFACFLVGVGGWVGGSV